MIRLRNFAYGLTVILISAFFMVILAEAFFRVYDGYSLMKMPLMRIHNRPVQFGDVNASLDNNDWPNAASYLDKLPLEKGTQKEWFFESPPPLAARGKFDPDLLRRKKMTANFGAAMGPGYVWNYNYLKEQICEKHREEEYFPGNEKQIYIYKPLTDNARPIYRFLPSRTYPDGLVINQFGFRSENIPYHKENNTIRIAFSGASTTIASHAFAFSYPELVGYWLNRWSQEQKLSIKFEVINAGRSGIASPDISRVIVEEIIPLSPDLVLYYEGSNQFWPSKFINYGIKKIFKKPSLTFQVMPIEKYSAFFQRIYQFNRLLQFHGGKELAKPPFTVTWPETLSEFDPDLASSEMPLNLDTILADWKTIQEACQNAKCDFIPLSFVWLVQPGMQLDIPKKMSIFVYLNQTFWPYPYAWMRRMADFQNRVFEKYARVNHLQFIDYAKYYPQDPVFFDDAIHMTYEGVRLQAWIVFQNLIPILEKKMASKELPKPSSQTQDMPESLVRAITPSLVTLEDVKKKC